MKRHWTGPLLRSFTDTQSVRLRQEGKRNPPRSEMLSCHKAAAARPKSTPRFKKLTNWRKDKRKEDGLWSIGGVTPPDGLFLLMCANIVALATFLLLLAGILMARCQLGAPAYLLHSWNRVMHEITHLSYLSLRARFSTFPSTCGSHSRDGIPGWVIQPVSKNTTRFRDGCWWRGGLQQNAFLCLNYKTAGSTAILPDFDSH